jgi:plastocyanin
VNGWITGFKADLRFKDGSVPPVDVVHLHHGVWLNTSSVDLTASVPERFFAAGEEKTAIKLPAPYGYRYRTTDRWMLNYMLHNLTPSPRKVWVIYEVEFIPDSSPLAAGMVPARPVWMDVQNGSVYPVFDSIKGSGDGITFTYPDQAVNPYPGKRKNEWVVDRDGVLVATAGHLHPGGLHTDLKISRGGTTAPLFRSEAKYFEPAGAVSWDVAMTATTPDWRVAVKKGDVLSTSATYDSATASWYESMGIMVVWMGDPGLPAPDPFTTAVDKPGMITHGHLKENDNHGGGPDPNYLDLTTLPSEPYSGIIEIRNWMYGKGDMFSGTSVPTVKPGQTITYDNKDAPIGKGQWHTLTACKAPCNRATGIAYPIADADIPFDSGELGTGGPPTANRTTWTIPSNLPAGTYTYFCRIHPLMRGAFRVEG